MFLYVLYHRFQGIHPAIIAAVASRETNVGADITVSRGWNAGHFEYGMLPVSHFLVVWLMYWSKNSQNNRYCRLLDQCNIQHVNNLIVNIHQKT